MECLVCGKEYKGSECPRCRFPDVQIPGDRQKAIDNLRPAIEAYRARFLQSVKLEIAVFFWKDENGTVVLDREERICLATADELQNGPRWLDQDFARIPQENAIIVTLYISIGDTVRREKVSIPNLHSPSLQQIGVEMEKDFNIRLLLRNGDSNLTRSETIML